MKQEEFWYNLEIEPIFRGYEFVENKTNIQELIEKVYASFEEQFAKQEATLNEYADTIYAQAKRIEELEAPKTCDGCVLNDYDRYKHLNIATKSKDV